MPNNDLQLHIYLTKGNLSSFLEALWKAPTGLRPTSYSLGEEDPRTDLAGLEDLKELVSENPAGFFLHSPACMYDLMGERLAEGFEVVAVYPKGKFNAEPDSETLFELAASSGLAFGWSACTEEYYHRNRFYLVRIGGDCETWAGRDLNHYLPGLYWITCVSEALLDQRDIPVETFKRDISGKLSGIDGDTCLLMQFHDKPTDWQENAKKLDKRCETIDGIFSLQEVKQALRNRWTLKAALEFLSEQYR